ncbi:MAG: serine protease, partial [Acidobacteria bacterium]|nr:serine protease [Acidobacteriota bacterium]
APESPAAACGLRVGDVVETIGGQSFTRLEIRRKLMEAGTAPLPLGVVREGHRLSLTLSTKAGARP